MYLSQSEAPTRQRENLHTDAAYLQLKQREDSYTAAKLHLQKHENLHTDAETSLYQLRLQEHENLHTDAAFVP